MNQSFKISKIIKPILTITIIAFVLMALIIVFLAPISKYAVEKYDIKFLGREITMDVPYINPLTGFVYLRNVKIYENKSDTLFFTSKSLTVNIEMFKLLNKSFQTSEITLNQPYVKISQNKKELNFSDIIKKFAKDYTKTEKKNSKKTNWELNNISIKNAIFYYEEKTLPFSYFIKEFDVASKKVGGENDTIITTFKFKSGPGFGTFAGEFSTNIKTLDYSMNLKIDKFDLSFFERYVKDIANFASVKGNLDAKVIALGNFKNAQDLASSGSITINDCAVGKTLTEPYASFKKFNITYQNISPKRKIYKIDSLHLQVPYFKYEKYNELDNLQMMFGTKGSIATQEKQNKGNRNILFAIGEFIKKVSLNFFKSNFKVNRLAIYNGNALYNDYSLTEKFSIAANPLTLIADSIERKEKWVDIMFKTGLKPYGDININMSINPKDSSDFNIKYNIKNIPAASFNPYFISYTSFPLDRGTIEVKGNWNVVNGNINSRNNILVIDPRISEKQKINGAKWLPLKFIMFFVRESGNVIDFEVPINGNLNDPKFKLNDVIWDVVRNIFVKPLTPIYRANVRTIEKEIENSLTIKWKFKEPVLKEKQDSFLENIATFLKKNDKAKIKINSVPNEPKEKEYIAIFEGKKLFLKHSCNLKEPLSCNDSVAIDKLSIKDEAFLNYLSKNTKNKLIFTTQEKCIQLVGTDKINGIYKKIIDQRFKLIKNYFKENGVGSKVIYNHTPINEIPYDGFSLFKISFNGKVPDVLVEAYNELSNYDSYNPRNKYKAIRKEIRREKKRI